MSVRINTLFPDFPEEGKQPPLTLGFTTDTSVPQPAVPVFLIHSFAHPFCDNPRCACQQQRVQKTAMLARLTQGEITLHRASSFDAPEGGKPRCNISPYRSSLSPAESSSKRSSKIAVAWATISCSPR